MIGGGLSDYNPDCFTERTPDRRSYRKQQSQDMRTRKLYLIYGSHDDLDSKWLPSWLGPE